MKTGPAIADILKKEGVEYLFAYPVNHLIEACAAVDIRPIIVRQERIGLHMADAMSRLSKGRKMGVFCMQNTPIRRPLVSRDMASAMCRPMRSWRTMMGRMSTAAQASIR